MRPWTSLPRPLLYLAASIFCAATSLYAFLWMYDARHPHHQVEIGFNLLTDTSFDPVSKSIPVFNVAPDSPAQRAGLLPGDQMIALNGVPLTSYAPFDHIWSTSSPGDPIEITVRRSSAPSPVTLHAVFRAPRDNQSVEGFGRASAQQILGLYPVFFLLVGFTVLFLRIEDPYAWLLSLYFACLIAAPGLPNVGYLSAFNRVFVNLFRGSFQGMLPALIYIFFAVFPQRSPLDRRLPWLKGLAVAIGVSQALPGLSRGDAQWPQFAFKLLAPLNASTLRLVLTYCLIVLGFVSLVWNSNSRESSADTRRKSRVLLFGTVVGILPVVLQHFLSDFLGYVPPFWVNACLGFMLLLYPLLLAYSIVRYRVLEIPALLRRSVRYVLVQRSYGILLFLSALLTILLFTHLFSGWFAEHSQFGMGLSALFGVGLVWVSGPFVKRGAQRIDRAFFRSSYDARLILQDLAEKTRSVTDRGELAALLEHHLVDAFHPKSLAFFFASDASTLVAAKTSGPAPVNSLPVNAPFLQELAVRGRAMDVPPPDSPDAPRDFPLAPLQPECFVPLLGQGSHLIGLLVLGQSLSEEPYSGEDKRLLDSVAGQTAIALDNIRMAETIADRLEVERRASHELEIARDVQSRLFPQVMPALKTLDYAGSCLQARQVGGDYYDFLDLGSSHFALVLADISGKGIAGALLMANLQANLRSRSAVAVDDLPRLLNSVNQLFYESTPDDRFATLFFCVYDDATRNLHYANCGHNPALVFRPDGSLVHLSSTSSVIGLSAKWECVTARMTLAPGDLLVIYTDGVTEANDADANEFGEARLIETVRAHAELPPAELLLRIQQAVQQFSAGDQFDDLTLLIARVH